MDNEAKQIAEGLLRECLVKLEDIQGQSAPVLYAQYTIDRVRTYLEQKQ